MTGIFSLKDVQSLLGQGLLNVYGYIGAGDDANAVNLANAFISFILPTLTPVQSNALAHIAVNVVNFLVADDSTTVNLSGFNGQRAGDPVSSFNTWSLTAVPWLAGVKAGGKRIAGVSETDTNQGQATPTLQALLELFAGTYATPFTINGLDATYWPALLRVENGQVVATPIATASYKRMSTQNTRKDYIGGGPITIPTGVTVSAVNLGTVETLPEVVRLSPLGPEFINEFGQMASLRATLPTIFDNIIDI